MEYEIVGRVFEGSFFEMGRQYAERLQRESPELCTAEGIASVFGPLSQPAFIEAVAQLRSWAPQVLEECEGFAEGIGIGLRHALALTGFGYVPTLFSGCSHVVVLPERTAGGRVLVGRNYDFGHEFYPEPVIQGRIPDHGPAFAGSSLFLGLHEGMNGHGLYVGINSAPGRLANPRGFFFHTIVAALLGRCAHVSEAVAMLQAIPHSTPYIYTLADERTACAVEVGEAGIAVVEPCDGLLVTTNHYQSARLENEQLRISEDSLIRHRALRMGLGRENFVSLDEVSQVLSAHGEQGACRHDYAGLDGTLWSCLFTPATRMGEYRAGCARQARETLQINLRRLGEAQGGVAKGVLPH